MPKQKCIWIIPRKCTPVEKMAGDAALEKYQKIAYGGNDTPYEIRREAYNAYKMELFELGLGILPGMDLCYVGKYSLKDFQRVRFVMEGSAYAKRFGAHAPTT